MVKKEVGSDKKWNAHIKVLYCFRKKKIYSDKYYADLAEKVWYKIAHRQEILLFLWHPAANHLCHLLSLHWKYSQISISRTPNGSNTTKVTNIKLT